MAFLACQQQIQKLWNNEAGGGGGRQGYINGVLISLYALNA